MGQKRSVYTFPWLFYDLHFTRSLCKAWHLREKETTWFINFFPLTGQTNCGNIKTWKTNFLWKKQKLSCLPSIAGIMSQTDLHCRGRSNILLLLHICVLFNVQVEDWKRGKERVYRKNKDEYSEGQEGRASVCVKYRQEKRRRTTTNKLLTNY